MVVFPCCRRWRNNLDELLDPFPFGVAARVEVGISGLRLVYRWPSFTG